MENMFDQAHQTHHYLFIDRLESELQQTLGNRIDRIEKLGRDILCEVSLQNVDTVLRELKNEEIFGLDSFRNIKLFWKKEIPYLLAVLYSYDNNFNLLIKTKLHKEDYRNEYNTLTEALARHYPAAEFFKKKKLLKKDAMDFTVYSQPASGLDCFDVYGILDEDLIKKAVIDTSVANISQHDLLADQNMLKLLSCISVFDYNAGIFPELCLCLGIEDILKMRISARAQSIRVVICELSRISNHLESIANMLEVLGYDLVLSQVLTEKEKILKIIEVITGARFLPNYIRVGGVRKDINSEKAGIIKKTLPQLLGNIKKIESRMLGNILVFNKLRDTGAITKSIAREFCLSGPNLRSAGIRKDIRKDKDYLLYDKLSFITPLGRYGDSLERVSIRFKEIYQSIKIIIHAMSRMPEGKIKKINNLVAFNFPYRSSFFSVECPHGAFQIYLETGSREIEALAVMGPSTNSLMAAEKILEGSRLEDLPIILASLDISAGEIIRNRWY
ncbi:MAG: hypothetical protein ACQEP5_03850 [Actinomycetota bacterium]